MKTRLMFPMDWNGPKFRVAFNPIGRAIYLLLLDGTILEKWFVGEKGKFLLVHQNLCDFLEGGMREGEWERLSEEMVMERWPLGNGLVRFKEGYMVSFSFLRRLS